MTTPELKRYHPSEFGDGMIPTNKGQWVSIADVEAYTQAAIAAAMMGAVKPLDWDGFVAGNYRIEINEEGKARLWYYSAAIFDDEEPEMLKGGYLTLVSIDDLKSIANAHNKTRILSALSIATDATAALAERDKRTREGSLEDAISAVNKVFNGFPNHAVDAIRAMKGGDA